MGLCCRGDWLVRPGDTPDEARIKTLGFPFALFSFPILSFAALVVMRSTLQYINAIGMIITALGMLLFLVGVTTDTLPAGFCLDVILVAGTVGFCAIDLGTATVSFPFRAWTVVVLLLDMALVFKRYHMPRFIIPFVL
eukprot:Hpha_TRINITY_DN16254_c3_g16::TRINITY_DN16254_c3_g16_i1::g.13868::m.13868